MPNHPQTTFEETCEGLEFGLLCAVVIFLGYASSMSKTYKHRHDNKGYPKKRKKGVKVYGDNWSTPPTPLHNQHKTIRTTITVSNEDIFANGMSPEEAKAYYEKTKKNNI